MSRSISVFGLGYVGTVTAACLAHKGNQVLGVDLSRSKVETLDAGQSPIVEPRVTELIAECNRACRLHATSDAATAVLKTEISFLCVGTPSLRNGKLDLGHIEPVCREIGEALKKKDTFHLVVLRSTVLPGTAEAIVVPTLEKASGKRMGKELGVDAEAVVEIFTADTKLNISPTYLKPGFAFGGSCLPKDVRALTYRAKELDLKLPLFESLLPSNEEHLERAVQMILDTGKK